MTGLRDSARDTVLTDRPVSSAMSFNVAPLPRCARRRPGRLAAGLWGLVRRFCSVGCVFSRPRGEMGLSAMGLASSAFYQYWGSRKRLHDS